MQILGCDKEIGQREREEAGKGGQAPKPKEKKQKPTVVMTSCYCYTLSTWNKKSEYFKVNKIFVLNPFSLYYIITHL